MWASCSGFSPMHINETDRYCFNQNNPLVTDKGSAIAQSSFITPFEVSKKFVI
jgi:hypothetical protein